MIGAGERQPDNRELKLTGQNDEACLAVLNNYYKDGVTWHDIACYHKKPFVCEDSDELIEFMRQTNPNANRHNTHHMNANQSDYKPSRYNTSECNTIIMQPNINPTI